MIFFPSCGRPYTGGLCDVPDDCASEAQNIPGTSCYDGICQCTDPYQHICCHKGDKSPECFKTCLPCDECEDPPSSCPPPASGACEVDTDCSGPPDPRCGSARCVEGACQLDIKPGPLESQVRGDCQHVECTAAGEVVSVEDSLDTYDDGNQCTVDLCDHRISRNAQLANVQCPVSQAGQCYEGACVQCVATDPIIRCTGGLACDGVLCVPAHCVNNVRDAGLGETGFNCGGQCRPCQPGDPCTVGADCVSGVCRNGSCQVPSCSDGVTNGSETGVDCGTSSCPRCPPGEGCATGAQCTSGVCWSGVCQEPSCTDSVQNGDEHGVDCGSERCPATCPG